MEPAVGAKAPSFTLTADTGEEFSLKTLLGSWVVLYFYPADMTPTCTNQACSFRDNMELLARENVTVVGISPDDVDSHLKFRSKHNLNFILLADPEKKVLEKYNTWKLKKMYGREYMGVVRTTFLIDPKGIIRKVWNKVKVATQIDDITATLLQMKQ